MLTNILTLENGDLPPKESGKWTTRSSFLNFTHECAVIRAKKLTLEPAASNPSLLPLFVCVCVLDGSHICNSRPAAACVHR